MAPARLNDWLKESRKSKGRWKLTSGHEVVYEGEGPDEEVSVRGPLVAVEPGRLVIAVREKQSAKKTVTRLVGLTGDWKVDSKNRIVFEVEKKTGKPDELVFRSGWRLNDRYEIVYSTKTTALKRKAKIERELVFSGNWDLSEKNRISFLIGGDSSSRLRFRGAFQTPSILAKKGEIRYQIGIEGRGGSQTRTLAFFGKWKLSRLFGLSFELETGEKRPRVWHFGGTWNFDEARRIEAGLRSPRGEPLGAEVVFARDFLEAGEAFVRFQKSAEESRVEAGARWTA